MDRESPRLTVNSVSEWVPWDAGKSADARAAARRVAAVLQARAFFVRVVLDRKPTNTMSEGIIGMLLATNTTLVEELIYGYFRHSLDRKMKQRGVKGLVDACEADGTLRTSTAQSTRDLIKARNGFVHADCGLVLPQKSPRLTDKIIWSRTFHQIPIRLSGELHAEHTFRCASNQSNLPDKK